MNLIIDNIFIGNYFDVLDISKLKNNNIKYIMNCAKELDYICSEKIKCLEVPLLPYQVPTKESMFEIIIFIEDSKLSNGNMLIHCYEGRVRAPTVLIGYLMYKGMTYDDAYELVKNKRSEIIIRKSTIIKNRLIKLVSDLQ